MWVTNLDLITFLRQQVKFMPRIAGEYLFEFSELSEPAGERTDLDRFLRVFAAQFGFCAPDVTDDEWKHAEVFREEAIQLLTKQLQGGSEIGHNIWDVEPNKAQRVANTFAAIFDFDARFFCNRALSGEAQVLGPCARREFRDYIFNGGCVAIDTKIVAIFWVFDND